MYPKGTKVICINAHNSSGLSEAREYILLEQGMDFLVCITNDQGLDQHYLSSRFVLSSTNTEPIPQANLGGLKNDSEKPDISLIPKAALWGMAKALTYGAKKYGKHNFRDGIAYSRLAAATLRHLSVWMEGEELDAESSNSHLDHALASLAMLKFMSEHRQDMDDRWLDPVHSPGDSDEK